MVNFKKGSKVRISITLILLFLLNVLVSTSSALNFSFKKNLPIFSTQAAKPVTFYQNINYSGYNVSLDTGDYTLSQLKQKGIQNNSISSIKVLSGYEVTVFDYDNFTGKLWTLKSDVNNFISIGCNDKMTSVKIRSLSSPVIIPTPTPTPTQTPIPTPTQTPTPTPTQTPIPTPTQTPTPTPTQTPIPTPTQIPTPTPTQVPSPTPAPTSTPLPLNNEKFEFLFSQGQPLLNGDFSIEIDNKIYSIQFSNDTLDSTIYKFKKLFSNIDGILLYNEYSPFEKRYCFDLLFLTPGDKGETKITSFPSHDGYNWAYITQWKPYCLETSEIHELSQFSDFLLSPGNSISPDTYLVCEVGDYIMEMPFDFTSADFSNRDNINDKIKYLLSQCPYIYKIYRRDDSIYVNISKENKDKTIRCYLRSDTTNYQVTDYKNLGIESSINNIQYYDETITTIPTDDNKFGYLDAYCGFHFRNQILH